MAKTGTRLENSGWEPCEKAQAFATECGLDWRETWEDFSDYWTSKPGANASKINWFATWRNWCRRNKQSRARGISSRFEARNSDRLPTNPEGVWVGGRRFTAFEIIGLRRKQSLRQPLDPDEQRALEAWNG